MKIPFTMTNDTVTVFLKGEPHAVTKGSPNYDALRKAVFDEDWDAIPKLISVEGAVEAWANKATTPPPTVTSEATGTAIPVVTAPAPKVTVTESTMLVDGKSQIKYRSAGGITPHHSPVQ